MRELKRRFVAADQQSVIVQNVDVRQIVQAIDRFLVRVSSDVPLCSGAKVFERFSWFTFAYEFDKKSSMRHAGPLLIRVLVCFTTIHTTSNPPYPFSHQDEQKEVRPEGALPDLTV
jgi:hypothetical protein